MSAPGSAREALAEFRSTLHAIIDLLVEHRLHQWVSGLQNLGSYAEEDPDRTPEQTLADLDREYTRFITIPDGFSAEYVRHGLDVDHAASDRLDALRTRLPAILRSAQRTS